MSIRIQLKTASSLPAGAHLVASLTSRASIFGGVLPESRLVLSSDVAPEGRFLMCCSDTHPSLTVTSVRESIPDAETRWVMVVGDVHEEGPWPSPVRP